MIRDSIKQKKPITLEERKSIQLEMLDEVHAFCKENDIRYSLAFGTLLGAIRHKGFIPWDDDVDIMMPMPDLLRFKEIFKSDRVQYHDVDTDRFHRFAFSLLSDRRTYRKAGLVCKECGVSIDLYVCIGMPEAKEGFINGAMPLYKKRMTAIGRRALFISKLPIKTIPFFSSVQKKYRDYLFNNSIPYNEAKSYYMIAGPLKDWKIMSYDYDLFDSLVDANFEDHVYRITEHYDHFLSLRYGDYMTPPPPEQQRPAHGGKYFWKNK